MKKVTLADRAGNQFQKRVGFSFGYLFLGPIYLLIRLRWEGILLLLVYFYLLPIPGMNFITDLIGKFNWNPDVISFFQRGLLYFRLSFNHPRVYFSMAFVLLFHILFSFICDNWILGKRIRKKGWAPLTEADARILIGAKSVKPDVLLAKEVSEKEHLFEQAERVWEDKNLSYTTMLSRSEIERIQDQALKNTKVPEDDAAHKRHIDNANLLAKGIITKEEYEILEKRTVKPTETNKKPIK